MKPFVDLRGLPDSLREWATQAFPVAIMPVFGHLLLAFEAKEIYSNGEVEVFCAARCDLCPGDELQQE